MQPLPIAHARLNRMTKGVAEVEDGPQAGLPLVLAHHLGFDFATALNGFGQRA